MSPVNNGQNEEQQQPQARQPVEQPRPGATVEGGSPAAESPTSTATPTYAPPTAGLINQGCTCYLNSLLQLLFQIGYFRSSVYRMTVDRRDESAAIPQALQELFFQMQERKTPPTTKGLTDAFGWDEREVFIQHDIQELAALLRDCLESRMRGTPIEGAINRLFEGTGEQVVQTLDKSYQSCIKDTFYDIHLPIQNFTNIIESLRSLTQKDQLVGDNKYKVEEEGKPAVYKDAEKGYRFVQFPPVIFFHLKRFEMDLTSPMLEMKKVNNLFEFQDVLNLREFENSDSPHNQRAQDEFDRDSQAVYDLVGVIVHRGTARSGHYYCYIRHFDAQEGKFTHWLEYDDDNVRVVDQDAAIDNNFGGVRYSTVNGRQHAFTSTNNAYILSYVRRSDRQVVLAPSPTDIIPESVKRELRRVMEADERRGAIEKKRRSTVRIVLATDDSINRSVRAHTTDLLAREERVNPTYCQYIDVQKSAPFPTLYNEICNALGSSYQRDSICLWKWVLIDKTIFRPVAMLSMERQGSLQIGQALLSQTLLEKDVMSNVLIYVERLRNYGPEPPVPAGAMKHRIFVKAFIPRDRSLMFLGGLDIVPTLPLKAYRGHLAAMLGVDATTPFVIALEGTQRIPAKFLSQETPCVNDLYQGECIVLQPHPLSVVYRNPTVVDFIAESRATFTIDVREKSSPTVSVGTVQALYHWDYESMCDGISHLLSSRQGGRSIRTDHIQLFRNTDTVTPTPCDAPLRSNCNLSAGNMCAVGHYVGNVLFFTLLQEPRTNIETQQKVQLKVFNQEGQVVKDVVVLTRLPVTFASLTKQALEASPIIPPTKQTTTGATTQQTAHGNKDTTDGSAKQDAPTPSKDGDAVAAPPPPPPAPTLTASTHYVAQFVFHSRSRPSRLPIDVSLLGGAEDESAPQLNRVLCPGEWIYLHPANPSGLTGGVTRKKFWGDDSDDDVEESHTVGSSSTVVEDPPRRWVRVPVTQGEYMSSHANAALFGYPHFITIDCDRTTMKEVLIAAATHFGIDVQDTLENPLMLVVEPGVADSDMLLSERDVETFSYQSKHYRFMHLDEVIYPFLENHGERYFVYVNLKKPKEKPGSRYVATNDPKLVLEKRKSAPQQV